MKVRRTPKGPFLEQPYFTDSEIETLCVAELTRENLLPLEPAPIRIDRFVEKRFGTHSYAELPDGVLGLTRFGSKGVEEIIVARALEDDTSKPVERRLRSTLAHEAGHGLLHAYLFALGQQRPLFGDWSEHNAPKVLCREPGLAPHYRGEWWEYQANMVMGTILLPKALVIRATQAYLQAEGSLGVGQLADSARGRAVRDLAEIFDVNPAMIRIRLEKIFPAQTTGQLSL